MAFRIFDHVIFPVYLKCFNNNTRFKMVNVVNTLSGIVVTILHTVQEVLYRVRIPVSPQALLTSLCSLMERRV